MAKEVKKELGKEIKGIRSYKIKGDVIVVKVGLFKSIKIENTTENVKLLNDILKKQHTRLDVKAVDDKSNKYAMNLIATSLVGIVASVCSFFFSFPVFPIIAYGALAVSAYPAFQCIRNWMKVRKHEKEEFLLQNEKELNEGIKSQESDTLTKKKMKSVGPVTKHNILKEKHEDRPVFDINSIKGMSLEGLKQLRANLDALVSDKEQEVTAENVAEEIVEQMASQEPALAGPTLQNKRK